MTSQLSPDQIEETSTATITELNKKLYDMVLSGKALKGRGEVEFFPLIGELHPAACRSRNGESIRRLRTATGPG